MTASRFLELLYTQPYGWFFLLLMVGAFLGWASNFSEKKMDFFPICFAAASFVSLVTASLMTILALLEGEGIVDTFRSTLFGSLLALVPAYLIFAFIYYSKKNQADYEAQKEVERTEAICEVVRLIYGRIEFLEIEEEAAREMQAADEVRRRRRRQKSLLEDHLLTMRSALRVLHKDPSHATMLNTLDETLKQISEDDLPEFSLTAEPWFQNEIREFSEIMVGSEISDPFIRRRLETLII